jgi:hypothetical protein
MMKLLGWSSSARYGCDIAPNYLGKKEGVTPQFHFVALLGATRLLVSLWERDNARF